MTDPYVPRVNPLYQISYGAFLADPAQGEASHSFCLHAAAWGDHIRKGEKAALATGKAQAIHNHKDGDGCNRGCTAILIHPNP